MLRRLCLEQPESFEFTTANSRWADEIVRKYPHGRQASAVIPLLWRAQEQEGWVSKPAINYIAAFLDMAPIRVFEVASFYFMFHLSPVGSIAHVQVCGTTPCMLRGSENLISVCKNSIAGNAHQISEDGKLSWEEVECLGACSNAPVVQIGKDYYEDLNTESFEELLMQFRNGDIPEPGSQIKRFSSEPFNERTSLDSEIVEEKNASVEKALKFKDTIGRVTGD